MNQRSSLRMIALLSLVVLAGCFGGGTVDSTPTPTWSPTPTQGEQKTPPSVTWLDDGSVTNVSVLLDAHVTGLLDRGFVTRVTAGGSTVRYVVARNRSAFLIEPVENTTFGAWSNGSVAAVRLDGGDGTTYRRVSPSRISTGELTQSARLRALLTSAKYRVTNLTTCGDARCFAIRANGSFVDSFENFSATARITKSGVVVHFAAEYVQVTEGDRDAIHYRFDVRDRGAVSIDRPSWLAEALNASSTAG